MINGETCQLLQYVLCGDDMRKLIRNMTVILMLLLIPIALILTDLVIPRQFDDTYYGQLREMYQKLASTEGKKIVIIGTSSVAFGVDSALLTQELNQCGLDYTVCNFGLYGTLGSKVMLDLSREHIGEGDIVIFAPELDSQVMSLFFSGSEVWYAIENDLDMFRAIPDKGSLMGSYPGYVAQKVGYFQTEKPGGSGIYAKASFDENGDLRYGDRSKNTMTGGYDPNNPIVFSEDLLDGDYIDYLNEYYGEISSRGAQMWYAFPPMNEAAIDADPAEIDRFCDLLLEAVDFELLGDPYSSIYEKEWFYDSNFHLNQAGMVCRTLQLADDIKTKFGITEACVTQVPEKPEMPEIELETVEEDADTDCFVFEEQEEGYAIVGLTEKGMEAVSLVIPGQYEGKLVVSIGQGVLAKATHLEEVIVSKSVKILNDGIFAGCGALKRIVLRQPDPTKISVGQNLLEGVADCRIYVPAGSLGAYQVNYFWSHYSGSLVSDAAREG